MSDEVTINFTLEELEVLNIVLTKLQELEIPPETKEEIDNEINKFIENLLIKIAKVKLEQNIIKEIPKI
jgi:CCR4-NOT transcriptional regulation complex NOT5 subunit